MTAIEYFDRALALVLVMMAAGYMFWKIALKPKYGRNPAVRLGPTLSRSIERSRAAKRRRS